MTTPYVTVYLVISLPNVPYIQGSGQPYITLLPYVPHQHRADVLSDPQKRQIYDAYGEEGLKGGVPPSGAGGPEGFRGGYSFSPDMVRLLCTWLPALCPSSFSPSPLSSKSLHLNLRPRSCAQKGHATG